jgi:OOP family OmpA-OmpF porin
VRDRLVAEHGIAPERLSAEGVGWLAPRATNATEAGREANRRVEAVVADR